MGSVWVGPEPELIVGYRTSYTCTKCHITLKKLIDKSENKDKDIWYCVSCKEEFLKDELSEEQYYEKHEVPPPPPIAGFQSGVRYIGEKRND